MSEKIWLVDVEIKLTMAVVAEDEAAAKKTARDFLEEELRNESYTVTLSPLGEGAVPNKDLAGSLPWGVDESDPRSHWPVERWLQE